jgi:hypothetical protein
MTEAEWLACGDACEMIGAFRSRVSDRKLRLFACGSCRQYPDFVNDVSLQHAVLAMEELADGELSEAERPHYNTFSHHSLICDLGSARGISSAFRTAGRLVEYGVPLQPILRDVAGNPFRPVAFDPEWRTSTAVALAQGMYESRDFGAMPILADALQDAGCDSDEVLDHCRDPQQVHVRGCWVVDLLLGKE